MKYPTLRFVFDRKHVSSKTKKGLVQIEVLSEGKRKWIGTGVKLYKEQWDEKRKVVNSTEMLQLNQCLEEQIRAIQDWLNGLIRGKKPFEFEKLERFLKASRVAESYIEFVERRIEERNDCRDSTKRSHRILPKVLREFGQITYMSDLTRQNMEAFDNWLHGKGFVQSTVHNYHKINKKYIHDALRAGLVSDDPYQGFRVDRGKHAIRKYLTMDEVERIRTCKISHGTIDKVRDLFIFQCYTGISYAELSAFDFKKAVQRDGKYIIHDDRVKTGEEFYIVLLPPALEILEKYGFALPVISNQQYNMRLKVVAEYAGIDKNLTTHMGRHTFAVFALNNGVPIEVVSKMLGHTNISTTQLYAKVLNREVEKGFDLLAGKLQ